MSACTSYVLICCRSLFPSAISVWCESAGANFGEVLIPASFNGTGLVSAADGPALECSFPEVSLGNLTTRAHDVSGEIFVLSESVLEIRGFTYDGAAPAVYIWADTNAEPSVAGFRLYDGSPTNGCGATPIADAADGTATYRVEFPNGTSILDILGGSISVWCDSFKVSFGEVSCRWSPFSAIAVSAVRSLTHE
jgi:Electron transfer DM13